MHSPRRPVLIVLLLLAIGLRTALGAPCCMEPVQVASHETGGTHASHGEGTSNHDDHVGDPSAKPCCSPCGPTLPPDPVILASGAAPRVVPAPAPLRAFATRPPFPAYEATGPPLRI